MGESEDAQSRTGQAADAGDEMEQAQQRTSPFWARILLFALIVAAATAIPVGAVLRSRGYEREAERFGLGGMFVPLGIAFLFYAFVCLRYARPLPFWMFFTMFGGDPVTRERRPWAYWYGIATIIGLGVVCLSGGIVCLVHGPFSWSWRASF